MSFDYSEFFRRISDELTTRDREWCGIPTPLPGKALVLESRHPYANRMAELEAIIDKDYGAAGGESPADDGSKIINQWHGRTKAGVTGQILIIERPDGRRTWGIEPDLPIRNRLLLGGLETLDAWNLDTELTAVELLSDLISPRMFKAYVLTGTFLEHSKRSGLVYLFRRLRPTVVLTASGGHVYDEPDRGMRILTCLCLHPLGYYSETMCGAMVPTDDVIAHLLLMRGDEKMFWRRANHHAPGTARSGL